MIAILWAAAWTISNLGWLASDHLIRDGDEEGHIGAAELFRADLLDGHPLHWLGRAWAGDMGDYPSFFPALTGAWWWTTGVGEPGVPQVRALGLLWVLLAASAAAALASRAQARGAGLLAFIALTLLPLPVGLGRHFMPEGMLVAATTVAVLAAVRVAERPSLGRGAALGLAIGAGFLVKQTFLLVGLPGVAAGLFIRPRQSFSKSAGLGAACATILVASLVAGPWCISQLPRQLRYSTGSALHVGEHAQLLGHAFYYPVVAALLVVGPVLTLLGLGAAIIGARSRWSPARRRVFTVALVWIGVSVLLLTLVPKKYPRLLAPVAPAVAVIIGVGLAGRRRALVAGATLVAGGAGWLFLRSTEPPLTLPATIQRVVPGCPQHWLRPAVDDDLGMAAVAALIRAAGPGPVRIIDGPEIPCQIQTTAPWAQHLGPYLRRTGQDRVLYIEPAQADTSDQPAGPAVLTIHWEPQGLPEGSGGQVVSVPLLGGRFRVLPGDS
ncbi:MAG: hypothetical protein GXP62_16185 [Oligoflexia bacterium]|nr:hypothetical protein [Oligoflexia bacterium]